MKILIEFIELLLVERYRKLIITKNNNNLMCFLNMRKNTKNLSLKNRGSKKNHACEPSLTQTCIQYYSKIIAIIETGNCKIRIHDSLLLNI